MAQWINLNQNNRSALALIFCIVRKTGPIILLLVGLMVGREADKPAGEIQLGFEIFKIPYR